LIVRRGRYPEEAYGRDVTVLAPLRDKLRELEQVSGAIVS
jgi:hypothetical protein